VAGYLLTSRYPSQRSANLEVFDPALVSGSQKSYSHFLTKPSDRLSEFIQSRKLARSWIVNVKRRVLSRRRTLQTLIQNQPLTVSTHRKLTTMNHPSGTHRDTSYQSCNCDLKSNKRNEKTEMREDKNKKHRRESTSKSLLFLLQSSVPDDQQKPLWITFCTHSSLFFESIYNIGQERYTELLSKRH